MVVCITGTRESEWKVRLVNYLMNWVHLFGFADNDEITMYDGSESMIDKLDNDKTLMKSAFFKLDAKSGQLVSSYPE